MAEPLDPQYEAEIRDRVAQLDSDRILTGSTWLASSVGAKSVLPPEQSNCVEDVLETGHSVIRGSVGVFASKLYAEFTAHARDDVPALLDEVDRLRKELAELTDRARRVAVSHELFIQDHSDPGTEALSAQYMLINFLSASDNHDGLPLNPIETALRVVLAQLDEWNEDVTPNEIRAAIAKVLPREDMSDNRRRVYVDGKSNGWIDQSVTSDGTRWVVPVNATGPAEKAKGVTERTGSLREIGRCW